MKTSIKWLAVGLVAVNASLSMAAGDGTISVEVNNTFNVNQQTELSFGVIRASADTTGNNGVATLYQPANGNLGTVTQDPSGEASIFVISDGEPGVFLIDGAAPFSYLTITFPTGNTQIRQTGQDVEFIIADTTWEAYIVQGNVSNQAYNTTTSNLQMDSNGTATIQIGATLSTDPAALSGARDYGNGAYVGTYQITLDY